MYTLTSIIKGLLSCTNSRQNVNMLHRPSLAENALATKFQKESTVLCTIFICYKP
jgi:hypothetical protein